MMTIQFKAAILSLGMLMNVSFAFAQDSDVEVKLKGKETKFVEVVTMDSLAPGEMLKRAENWVKSEKQTFKTSSGSTSGGKVECEALFPAKPKELNPQVDWTGKISMKVVIECKDNRYRYTVSDIKHVSKSGGANGGSIDNVVPECGSMVMDDKLWKHIKNDASKHAQTVIRSLKEGMNKDSEEKKEDEW